MLVGGDREARVMVRLHCVLLVGEGRPVGEVARWFGIHRRTLERWVAHYRAQGQDGLRDGGRCGRPPRLGEQEFETLRGEIAEPPVALGYYSPEWSGRLLKAHLAGRYSVSFSLRQCQRLLRNLREPVPLPQA